MPAAAALYKSKTGQDLLPLGQDSAAIQNSINKSYDPATGKLANFEISNYRDVRDVVDAYNSGGEKALEDTIARQNGKTTEQLKAEREAQNQKQSDYDREQEINKYIPSDKDLRFQATQQLIGEKNSTAEQIKRGDDPANPTTELPTEDEIQARINEIKSALPTRDQIKEAIDQGKQDSFLSGAFSRAQGRLVRTVRGILRPVSDEAYRDFAQRANQQDIYASATDENAPDVVRSMPLVKEGVDLVVGLPTDLGSLASFSRLPGGQMMAFAALNAAQASGSGKHI